MGEAMTIFVLALMLGVCHGYSINFKSLVHDFVVPEIEEKVAKDLKHLKVKLPDSMAGLRIPTNKEDLEKLKPALKEIEKSLPADLQHLQDSVSDLSDKTGDIRRTLQPILKALEREVLKDLGVKGTKQGCGCVEYLCTCCVHLEVDKIKLDDTVCAGVAYLPNDIGVGFTLTLNGKTLINKTMSVRNPPPICVGIPHLEKDASVCILFSQLNYDKSNKKFSGCVSVEIKLRYVVMKKVKIGCFNMPLEGPMHGLHLGNGTSKNSTQVTKEDQLKMLFRLGLMGKTFKNGRLINQNLLNN